MTPLQKTPTITKKHFYGTDTPQATWAGTYKTQVLSSGSSWFAEQGTRQQIKVAHKTAALMTFWIGGFMKSILFLPQKQEYGCSWLELKVCGEETPSRPSVGYIVFSVYET